MVRLLTQQLYEAVIQARLIAELCGDAAARIEDLEDDVSRLEADLADARVDRWQ
jgi:hypothetical protein